MQKGFATLEIIFAVLIISLLASATIPNAARIVDRVALDYETKKIYTDLRFLQSFDRMAYMKEEHFENAADNSINLVVSPEKYIFKGNSIVKTYDEHNFSYGVTASKKNHNEGWIIKFNDMGKISPAESDHLTLTSGQGKEFYIYFDSVGRFLPSNVNKYLP